MTSRGLALPFALATTLLAPAAHAQVPRPRFGVGLAVQLDAVVPPGLGSVGSRQPYASDPLSAGYMVRFHARLTPRVLLHLDVSAFHWFASERYAFTQTSTPVVLSTQAVFVPFDLGARVNVLPVLGPHQLLVGGGARVLYAPWQESLDPTGGMARPYVTGRGGGVGAGVFAEIAYEVLFSRRIGLEVSTRYAIGLAPQSLGTSAGRYNDPITVSTLSFAFGANYYF